MMKTILSLFFLLLPLQALSQHSLPEHPYGVYFESWSTKSDGSDIKQLPQYVSVLYLAFAKPEIQYVEGSYDISSTGLQFPYDGRQLKANLAALKEKHPDIKVVLAIGGATYNNWHSDINYAAVKALVDDLGVDGIDIDYENQVAGNQQLIKLIKAYRSALPKPQYLLTFAAMHTCAYGEEGSNWQDAQPKYSPWNGFCLPVFEQAASDIDIINVMSYDAGPTFVPETAYNAFKYYYLNAYPEGRILMGMEVGNDAWPTSPAHATWTKPIVKSMAEAIVLDGHQNGAMVWSAQKPASTAELPNATDISQTICNAFNLPQCELPLIAGRITQQEEVAPSFFFNTGAQGGRRLIFNIVDSKGLYVAYTGSIPPAKQSSQKITAASLKNSWLQIYTKLEGGAQQFIMCQALNEKSKPLGYAVGLQYGREDSKVPGSPWKVNYTVCG